MTSIGSPGSLQGPDGQLPGWGVLFRDGSLQEALVTGLDGVEALLRRSVDSDDALISETSLHLFDAGGKRYRPLLVLLAAQFGDASRPEVTSAAVVVELTHLATLYHDDVMDQASLRHGAESANRRWDNTVAILTGDFLFARASELVADLGPEAVRLQARTFQRLVTGQIRETVGPRDGEDPLEFYLGVLADKTSSLLATSARFGAMLSGADANTVEVLTRFGEFFGMAFQLSDDVLDVASESTQSGKVPGTDLREGITTLPVLHALRSTDPADARLQELLRSDLRADVPHAEALALLRGHPAIETARADVRRWADDARGVLAALPDVPARRALEDLCEATVLRTG